MKKIKLIMLGLFTLVTMFSCNNSKDEYSTTKETVLNSGEIFVKNGKDEVDTIPFTCTGCSENLTVNQFNTIVEHSVKLTKESLKYPLSFIPKELDLTIIKEDSLYMVGTNKKFDNTFTIISSHKYIGKNSYGNELEGDGLVSFNLVDGKIKDITDEIKLKDLKFDGKYINRSLNGFHKTDFIKLTPTIQKNILIESSITCVDEGAIFTIIFNNKEESEIKLAGSFNDFNCDGVAYFKWFSNSQIEKLKTTDIKYLYIYSRGESVMVPISKNQNDYFKQLFNLY